VKSQVRDLIRDDSRLEVGATIESLLAETGQELPDNLGGGEIAAPGAQAGAEAAVDTSAFESRYGPRARPSEPLPPNQTSHSCW
jgi:hypothetical protein